MRRDKKQTGGECQGKELWLKPFAKGLRRAREAEPLGQGAKATRQQSHK